MIDLNMAQLLLAAVTGASSAFGVSAVKHRAVAEKLEDASTALKTTQEELRKLQLETADRLARMETKLDLLLRR